MSGIQRIANERKRQLNEEGWSFFHDSQHTDGALAVAAAVLAVHETDAEVWESGDTELTDVWGLVEKHKDNPVRRLEIAGALIAAEIDRMERIADKG